MACVVRAARGSFDTILEFLIMRNAAENLNKFIIITFKINLCNNLKGNNNEKR